jgi:class 3 adenylate cyclase
LSPLRAGTDCLRASTEGLRRLLATVLFTDIVGSTELASRLGDRRWRDLVNRHHAAVRGGLKSFGGREMDTAGDGFFAIFDRPTEAVACAFTLVQSAKRLGIDIRAGLHMGECEVIDGKVGGIAVHIGARVAANAEPGEVLVSGTLKEMVSGSDFGFQDRGTKTLKGVPGEWRLFRVEAPPLEEPVHEDIQASKRRWSVRLVAAAVGILMVAALIALATRQSGSGSGAGAGPTSPIPPPVKDFVVKLDPATGRIAARIPVERNPVALAAASGSIWVVNGDETISRIDPVSGKVVSTIEAGSDPRAIAGDEESIWVLQLRAHKAIRIDAGSNRILKSVSIEGRPRELAVDRGSVWIVVDGLCPGGSPTGCIPVAVQRIDTRRNEVVDRVLIPGVSQLQQSGSGEGAQLNIAAAGNAVWLGTETGLLVRIDQATGSITKRVKLGIAVGDIGLHGEHLWVAAFGTPGTAFLFDAATGKRLAAIPAGGGAPPGSQSERASPIRIVAATEGIWITDGENGTVGRILEVDRQARPPIRVGDVPVGVAARFGFVWVAVDGR